MKQPLNRSEGLKRLVILGGLLVVGWVGLVLPLFSFLTIASFVAAIALVIRWRSAIPLSVLIFSPLGVSFIHGAAEWFTEKPRFHRMGLPGNEFFNLNRESRCYRSTGGCVVRGGEWIYQDPHNAGLRFMTILFGAPRGTYHGPYPTKEEAIKLTDNATETPPELFLKDNLLINGKSTSLQPKTSKNILSDSGMIFSDADLPGSTRKVRAHLLDNRCLLIRVSEKDSMTGERAFDEADGIVLFDVVSMKAFARYVVAGERAQRIPRLLLD